VEETGDDQTFFFTLLDFVEMLCRIFFILWCDFKVNYLLNDVYYFSAGDTLETVTSTYLISHYLFMTIQPKTRQASQW